MTLTNLSQVTTSGIATLTDINLNNLTGVAATFTGDVTVGGTLTYDDVTNIDSVGLVTARNGIEIISGDLTIPDSIVHRGDTNTKIRFPAADTITAETAGSERLRITSAGVVGIGTDDPSGDYRVTIKSSTAPHSALRLDTSESNYNTNLYFAKQGTNKWIVGNKADADAFRIVAGSTEVVRITSDGKFGIGTTGMAAKLDVRESGDPSNGLLVFAKNTTSNGNGAFYASEVSGVGNWSSGMPDNTNAYTIVQGIGNNGTERLRITSAGNVGVGNNNPTAKLDVSGNLYVSSDSFTGENAGIFFSGWNDYGAGVYGRNSGNDLVINAGSGEKVRVTSVGTVGVCTASPASRLHVHAPNSDLSTIRLSGTAANQVEYDIRQGIVGVNNAGFSIRDITNSATRLVITSAGKVGIGTDNPSELLHLQSGWTKQILKSTNLNTASSLIFDTHNINTADYLLGQLAGRWNGNDVAYINFEAGADTTNKDDGVITFLTSSASSTPTERFRVDGSGVVQIGKGDEGNSAYQTVELFVGSTNENYSVIRGKYNRTNQFNRSEVRFGVEDNSNGRGFLAFATGNNSASEAMRIKSDGTILMGGQTGSYDGQFVNLELRTDSNTVGGSMTLVNATAAQAGATCEIDCYQNYRGAGKIVFGRENGNNWQSSASGAASFLGFHTNNAGTISEKLRITSDGTVNIGGSYTQNASKLYVQNGGECRVEINGNAAAGGTGAVLVLKNRNSNNATGSGIQGEDASGQTTCSIQFINHSDASNEGSLKFFTRPGNGNLTEHMYIDGNGPAYFKNSTGSLYVSSTTGNDGGRIVFRENNTEAWSIDSTRANAPIVITDEYNNKERLRIDASGKISWNDSSSNLVTTDTMMIQANNAGSTKSMLAIRGGDSGYVHAAIRLVASSSHNNGNGRGTGTFYYDEVSDVEWFAGRPYSSSDYFIVARNYDITNANTGGVTAQHGRAMWFVDNTGATRQKKEQCIYRVESSHKSSRINTVQGKQGTYSTCTIDFNQASYGSVTYDIKIAGYSAAFFHRAGTYYCNSGLYANYVSLNNSSGNISHTQAYTSSQTVRHTFSFTNGFVHPVCEVTASAGGDAYFTEGSITITWA